MKARIITICLWLDGSELCRYQNFCLMLLLTVARWLPSTKVAAPVILEEKHYFQALILL